MNKLIIAGAGSPELLSNPINETGLVIVDNPKIISRIQEPLYYLPEESSTCKGKRHQYREKDGEWVCNCGKKL